MVQIIRAEYGVTVRGSIYTPAGGPGGPKMTFFNYCKFGNFLENFF